MKNVFLKGWLAFSSIVIAGLLLNSLLVSAEEELLNFLHKGFPGEGWTMTYLGPCADDTLYYAMEFLYPRHKQNDLKTYVFCQKNFSVSKARYGFVSDLDSIHCDSQKLYTEEEVISFLKAVKVLK